MQKHTRSTDNILEEMIDIHGLKEVLFSLSRLCDCKAEHIVESYGDKILAKEWTQNANRIFQTAQKVNV